MSSHEHTVLIPVDEPQKRPLGLANRKSRKDGEGRLKAPRTALQPGAITRREWLRFLYYTTIGDVCQCNETPHRHWFWNGTRDTTGGYGTFMWRGHLYKAHRFACVALGKAIPESWQPDHLCRIRHCVQPQCLEVVTKRINVLRGIGPTAQMAQKTHCVNGHLLEGDNLRQSPLQKDGHRKCRLCFNEHHRQRYHRERADVSQREAPTHCPAGHPFTPSTLYIGQDGRIRCRTCLNITTRARRQRKRLSSTP